MKSIKNITIVSRQRQTVGRWDSYISSLSADMVIWCRVPLDAGCRSRLS